MTVPTVKQLGRDLKYKFRAGLHWSPNFLFQKLLQSICFFKTHFSLTNRHCSEQKDWLERERERERMRAI